MTKTNGHHADVNDESKESREQFSTDFDVLKSSFAQLREDVHKVLGSALGTGKSGAAALKDRAADAVGDLNDRLGDGKQRIQESFEKLGQKIEQRPLMSAAIALGIGFLLAKLLHTKR